MQTLTSNELRAARGGIEPVTAAVAVLVAGATLYSAAKSIYAFGKAVGGWIVANHENYED